MDMRPVAWWPVLTLLVMAAIAEIHSRRIPNWLVLPFLAAGVMDTPEPHYALATVDVTHTYNPFIPMFAFSQFGISSTLPTSAIHRTDIIRMLQ
jgi:Flp pilus assembly protein protease CpaA